MRAAVRDKKTDRGGPAYRLFSSNTVGTGGPPSVIIDTRLELIGQSMILPQQHADRIEPSSIRFHEFVSPSWVEDCERALERLKQLADGWDGYDAEAPSEKAHSLAQQVLTLLSDRDLQPSRVAPSIEGGLVFAFSVDELYADIECLNSGEILAVTSQPGEDPLVWELDQDTLEETIDQLERFLTAE